MNPSDQAGRFAAVFREPRACAWRALDGSRRSERSRERAEDSESVMGPAASAIRAHVDDEVSLVVELEAATIDRPGLQRPRLGVALRVHHERNRRARGISRDRFGWW